MELAGTGIWSMQLRYGDPGEIAEAAAELEELGYSALWIPDVGGPVLDSVALLLESTREVIVATGILNLWMHDPSDVAERAGALIDAHGARFLCGIGVSHAPLIDAQEAGRYQRPLAAMASFLDGLDGAERPLGPEHRVLAALGPKMLALADQRASGVHPYLVTPEHTAIARAALGPSKLVLPEQSVILAETRDEARAIGAPWLKGYLSLPNYANNLKRLGYSEADIGSVSDALFDALIAWGDEGSIKARLDEHRAAGADHICVQVLEGEGAGFPRDAWRRLAPVLT